MKLVLAQRVSKLEKKVASQVRTGPLGGESVYQPSKADLSQAVAILVKCGAMRAVRMGPPSKGPDLQAESEDSWDDERILRPMLKNGTIVQ